MQSHGSSTRLHRTSLLASAGLAVIGFATIAGVPAPLHAAEPAKTHNLDKSALAIEGYDPVAYFPEGGGKPAKGDAANTVTHEGVTYRFTSRDHAELFKKHPARYVPAHGGWCTYAMGKDGSKVEVDPKSYVVSNGRLFLFYKDLITDTRKSFLKEQASLTKAADTNWKKLSGEDPRTGELTAPSLQARLDEARARMEANAPQAAKDLYERGIKSTADSGVLERAMKKGDPAPDFTLPDASGRPVRLADLLQQGPVVVTWYRGGWCPYCNLQLAAYQEALGDMKAAGATLVAISPQLPDSSISTKEKNHLEFTVLSDVGNKVARQYGLVYTLSPELVQAFKGRLDLPKYNGDESWELPVTGTYVIARDGKIAYAFVNADYRKRAEVSEVIDALRALK